jgi:chromosome segregation ATPase
VHEVNARRNQGDPRAEPVGSLPPASGPTPIARVMMRSGQQPARHAPEPSRTEDSDAMTVQQLRAELDALTIIERELRDRAIDVGVRIAELERALEKKDVRIAGLLEQVREVETLRESVDRAGCEVAELQETLRLERAEKAALAEAVARLQRLLCDAG